MRTAAELSGLAVVSQTAGERLGRIQDLLLEEASGRITGFVVRTGGLFSKPQLLTRLLVRSLGPDALIVEGGAVLEEAQSEPVIAGSVSAHTLDGRPVLDATGKVIGQVADVLVDEEQMTVVALLLSTGLVQNLLHGKPQLPFPLIQALGQDSIIVPADYDPRTAQTHPASR